jgi:hypothetical protein
MLNNYITYNLYNLIHTNKIVIIYHNEFLKRGKGSLIDHGAHRKNF